MHENTANITTQLVGFSTDAQQTPIIYQKNQQTILYVPPLTNANHIYHAYISNNF